MTYEYNGFNQLTEKENAAGTTTYIYDSRGNQISESSSSGEMEFDYFITGELKNVKQNNITIQENKYNHEGIRIIREEDNTARNYYYVNGSPVYTTDNDERTSVNLMNPYGEILSTYRGESGQEAYTYLKDIQGSTGIILDESGAAEAVYTYSDFGEVTENITPDIDNEICYTGAVYDDATGLHYMNARYYDPENGRFISQDSYRGELKYWVQWHLYAYCANNPVNYTDSTGHNPAYKVVEFSAVILGILIVAYSTTQTEFRDIWSDATSGFENTFSSVSKKAKELADAVCTALGNSFAKAKKLDKDKTDEKHHIIPQTAEKTKTARNIWTKHMGLSINDARNIIPLKYGLHRRLHSKAYYGLVEYLVTNAYGKGTLKKNKDKKCS